MRPPKFPWGDETELALRSLWSSGKKASVVAAELQAFGYITRCSVIGKARRLGLESRVCAGTKHATIKPKRQREPKPRKPFVLRPIAFRGRPMEALPLPAQPVTDVARVAFMDLEPHHCRWPVGEPVAGFCGCDKVEGTSYCAGHAARAFATPSTNRQSPQPTPNVGMTAIVAVEEFLAEASA